MSARPRRVPRLCQHKRSGRGYVTDPRTGKEVYFGIFGTAECDDGYERWRAEFVAREKETPGLAPGMPRLTVSQLVKSYLQHAEVYYRKNGKPTTEVGTISQATRFLEPFFSIHIADFSTFNLKTARQAMLDAGLEGNHVNKQVGRIRRVWKWAVEHELVSEAVLYRLAQIAPLVPGRMDIREEDPIAPVELTVVEATLPHMPQRDRALVLVHLHTGSRCEEVVSLRPRDIDRTGEPWACCVRDEVNKAAHRKRKDRREGRLRTVYFGPRARAAMLPLIGGTLSPDAWLFPSHGRGRNHHIRGGHITVNGYRQAVESAVVRANRVRDVGNAVLHLYRTTGGEPAFTVWVLARRLQFQEQSKPLRTALDLLLVTGAIVFDPATKLYRPGPTMPAAVLQHLPHWFPLQLRHTALTRVRASYGLEGAQAIGGHAEVETSQIYAEKSMTLARHIAEEMG